MVLTIPRLSFGKEWIKDRWIEWELENPDWILEWKPPDKWLPGEQRWLEGEDTWREKLRRQTLKTQEWYDSQGEKMQEFRRRIREEEAVRKAAKREAKRLRKTEDERRTNEWWANHPEELKRLNHKDQEKKEDESKKSDSGSEGHLLTHPDKARVTLAGGLLALSRVGTALSKGVCGDDPSIEKGKN
jgi:hypothetical protein